MTSHYFITATGTDQGKTLVTTALCHQLHKAGRIVNALKPVISGFSDPFTSDTGQILRSLSREVTPHNIAAISPWRFKEPLSPDLAAQKSSSDDLLSLDAISHWCLNAALPNNDAGSTHTTLVEGAGGGMSPLTRTHTNLDLATALDWPVIIVCASYLGCISHILSLIDVYSARSLTLAGLVLTQAEATAQPIHITLESLTPHLPASLPLFTIPHLTGMNEPWCECPDLTGLLRHEY